MTSLRLALLSLLIALAGCRSDSFRPEDARFNGLVVNIQHSITAWGMGAVVGSRHVITTEHVMDGATKASVGGRSATVVARVPSTREDIIVLELDEGVPSFEMHEIFKMTPNSVPWEVWTLRNRQLLIPSLVISGDSGSPILSTAGSIVGLVYGREHDQQIDWEKHQTRVVPGQRTLSNPLPSGFRIP